MYDEFRRHYFSSRNTNRYKIYVFCVGKNIRLKYNQRVFKVSTLRVKDLIRRVKQARSRRKKKRKKIKSRERRRRGRGRDERRDAIYIRYRGRSTRKHPRLSYHVSSSSIFLSVSRFIFLRAHLVSARWRRDKLANKSPSHVAVYPLPFLPMLRPTSSSCGPSDHGLFEVDTRKRAGSLW